MPTLSIHYVHYQIVCLTRRVVVLMNPPHPITPPPSKTKASAHQIWLHTPQPIVCYITVC